MLKCISHPGLEDFSQDRLDVEDVDSGGVEMRPGAGGVAGSAGQRKASATADLLSSTRAYLSCVLASSALDGSVTAANNAAIDNKIEQAMDLVKSHLMFAVREEVEILKEQIKCLMAKNNRLEFENAILREHASAETLAKLKKPLNQSQVIENP